MKELAEMGVKGGRDYLEMRENRKIKTDYRVNECGR